MPKLDPTAPKSPAGKTGGLPSAAPAADEATANIAAILMRRAAMEMSDDDGDDDDGDDDGDDWE